MSATLSLGMAHNIANHHISKQTLGDLTSRELTLEEINLVGGSLSRREVVVGATILGAVIGTGLGFTVGGFLESGMAAFPGAGFGWSAGHVLSDYLGIW